MKKGRRMYSMEIRLVKTNKEFLETYKEYLEKYPVELQLFLLNLADEAKVLDQTSSRGGVWQDGKLALLFLDANPFNLQLYGVDNSEAATASLVRYLTDNDIKIKGILGNAVDTDLFKKCYLKLNEVTFRKHLAMDIMVLERLNGMLPGGTIVHPSEDDFEFLFQGIKAFCLEALHEEMDDETARQRVQAFLKDEHFYLYKNDEGIPVSFAHARLTTDGGSRLSMVFTKAIFRNRGYGKSMMYLVSQRLLSQSSYCTLFVDKDNPVSNKAYKDVGYRILRDNIEYMIDR
jgi:predicted GNAT family acetyltransferase